MAELKFDTGFRVIEEYLSQINSILRIKLSICQLKYSPITRNDGRILVQPVTQLFRSN